VRFYDLTGALAGETTVTAIEPLLSYVPPRAPASYFRFFNQVLSGSQYFQLTLAQAIPAQTSWVVSDVSAVGNGFSVTGCNVRGGRARAMLIKAGNGTIRGCQMVDTACGLCVMPEMAAWGESDYAQGLTISDNTFTHVGEGRQYFTGALFIGAYEHVPGGADTANQYVPLPGGHRNIMVANNTFKNDNGVNLVVSSTENIQILNNNFINPMQTPIAFIDYKIIPADQGSLIWMTQSTGVQVAGNLVSNAGPQMVTPITGTSTTRGTGFVAGGTASQQTTAFVHNGNAIGREVAGFFDGGCLPRCGGQRLAQFLGYGGEQ
jgi:hypothetical protein